MQAEMENENLYRVDPDILRNHNDLKPYMKSMLVDWMKEVAESYRLKRETLYLAIAYLERY